MAVQCVAAHAARTMDRMCSIAEYWDSLGNARDCFRQVSCENHLRDAATGPAVIRLRSRCRLDASARIDRQERLGAPGIQHKGSVGVLPSRQTASNYIAFKARFQVATSAICRESLAAAPAAVARKNDDLAVGMKMKGKMKGKMGSELIFGSPGMASRPGSVCFPAAPVE